MAGSAQSLLADDIDPPVWRGMPNSTMQAWEFDTEPGPGEVTFAPDDSRNEYGTPLATLYGKFELPQRDTWWFEEVSGHEGVWNVGGAIGLYIPNDETPREYKFIRLQLTFDGGHALENVPFDPWIDVTSSEGPLEVSFPQTQSTQLDDVFTHAVYDIVLQPNRSDETIWIQPRYCQVYIDEIVVDTICSDGDPAPNVPEPSSALGLLAMSLVGLVIYGWKRRRSG